MKKILILSEGVYPFSVGGIEKHTADITKCFLEEGIEVTLIFSVPFGQELPTREEVSQKLGISNSGFESATVNFPSKGNFPGHYIRNSYRLSGKMYQLIMDKLSGFDFVYGQGFTSWYFLKEKSKGVKIPPIGINFHGLNMFQRSTSFRMQMESFMFRRPVKWMLRRADFVFTFGGQLDKIYDGLKIKGVRIPHPIGILHDEIITAIPELESHRRKFVFVGRFDKVKGLKYLYSAIDRIPIGKFEFLFIGDIPENFRLKRPDCTYAGLLNREQVSESLTKSEVLILPSLSEGMPFVILEAMAKGLVILASDVGAVNVMVDGSNGHLFSKGDVNGILDAIEWAGQLRMEELLELRKASLKKAAEFDWKHITEKVVSNLKSNLNVS